MRCWLGAACFSRSHNYNLHDFGEGAVFRGCNLQVAGCRSQVEGQNLKYARQSTLN